MSDATLSPCARVNKITCAVIKLTPVGDRARYHGPPRPHRSRSTHAMEDAMARINLWNKSVPRVELDHRARDARLQLVRVERLVVPRASVRGLWLSPFVRLLGSRAGGRRQRDGRGGGSQSDPRLGCMPGIESVWFEERGQCSRVCSRGRQKAQSPHNKAVLLGSGSSQTSRMLTASGPLPPSIMSTATR